MKEYLIRKNEGYLSGYFIYRQIKTKPLQEKRLGKNNYLLTDSFNALPATKAGTFAALI